MQHLIDCLSMSYEAVSLCRANCLHCRKTREKINIQNTLLNAAML